MFVGVPRDVSASDGLPGGTKMLALGMPNHLYSAGRTSSVRMVEDMSPPTTTVARGVSKRRRLIAPKQVFRNIHANMENLPRLAERGDLALWPLQCFVRFLCEEV